MRWERPGDISVTLPLPRSLSLVILLTVYHTFPWMLVEKNLVLDQPITNNLYFSLHSSLVLSLCIHVVRRNSVMVTHESLRVKGTKYNVKNVGWLKSWMSSTHVLTGKKMRMQKLNTCRTKRLHGYWFHQHPPKRYETYQNNLFGWMKIWDSCPVFEILNDCFLRDQLVRVLLRNILVALAAKYFLGFACEEKWHDVRRNLLFAFFFASNRGVCIFFSFFRHFNDKFP